MGFVVDKVALDQFFFFLIALLPYQCHFTSSPCSFIHPSLTLHNLRNY